MFNKKVIKMNQITLNYFKNIILFYFIILSIMYK